MLKHRFSVVIQLLSRVWLIATPWTIACQASLSSTISRSSLKFMSIESVMPSNYLILCSLLLLLPSIFSSIRVFSSEKVSSSHSVQFSSVQSLSCDRLFATAWIAARQASLSITNSRSSLKLTSIQSVMPSSHLILCRPLLLLIPIPLVIYFILIHSSLYVSVSIFQFNSPPFPSLVSIYLKECYSLHLFKY